MQYHWRRKVDDFSLLFGGPLYSRIRVVRKNPNQARFMTRFTLGSMWVPVLSFVTELWPSLRVSFYVSSILVRCLCKYWRNISTTRQVKYDETEWSETCCLHEHCQHPLLYSCLHLPLSYLSFLYIYFFIYPFISLHILCCTELAPEMGYSARYYFLLRGLIYTTCAPGFYLTTRV